MQQFVEAFDEMALNLCFKRNSQAKQKVKLTHNLKIRSSEIRLLVRKNTCINFIHSLKNALTVCCTNNMLVAAEIELPSSHTTPISHRFQTAISSNCLFNSLHSAQHITDSLAEKTHSEEALRRSARWSKPTATTPWFHTTRSAEDSAKEPTTDWSVCNTKYVE